MCELPTVSSESTVTARKTHCCCECDMQINKGDRYVVFEGMWNGEWERYKRCVDCVEAINDYWDRPGAVSGDPDDVIEFGCAIESLEEWARDQDPDDVPDSIKRFIERCNAGGVMCGHCRALVHCDDCDKGGACPGNMFCSSCNGEIDGGTGEAQHQPCGKCSWCIEHRSEKTGP